MHAVLRCAVLQSNGKLHDALSPAGDQDVLTLEIVPLATLYY